MNAYREELIKQECRCVTCHCCNGSGNVRYRTGTYPEWDLETCDFCYGHGVEEICDRCLELGEIDAFEI